MIPFIFNNSTFIEERCCFCNSLGILVRSPCRYSSPRKICRRCNNSINDKNPSKSFVNNALKCFSDHQFFIPAIDKDLLTRFVDTLAGFELFSFTFSSKEAINFMEAEEFGLFFEKLIVATNMVIDGENTFIPSLSDTYILVIQNLKIMNISEKTKNLHAKLFDSIYSNYLLIKAKFIELNNLHISADIFYQFLSPQLLELKCFKVKFTTLLNPIEFIEKIPNIEKFIFSNYDDDYYYCLELIGENLSIEYKDLKKFCLPFSKLNLSTQCFSGIVKNWSKNQKTIFHSIIGSTVDEVLANLILDVEMKNLNVEK